MLRKGATVVSDTKEDQLLSLLFLLKKKEMGESPSIQPKGPEQQYSILALQDGMVVPIKGNLFTRGQNVKDGPGGCILCNSLVSEIQEVCQISVERPSNEFFFLWFGFSPAPLVFAKLLKVPISLLRKLNVRIKIYLDNILLIVSSLEDLLISRDTPTLIL